MGLKKNPKKQLSVFLHCKILKMIRIDMNLFILIFTLFLLNAVDSV